MKSFLLVACICVRMVLWYDATMPFIRVWYCRICYQTGREDIPFSYLHSLRLRRFDARYLRHSTWTPNFAVDRLSAVRKVIWLNAYLRQGQQHKSGPICPICLSIYHQQESCRIEQVSDETDEFFLLKRSLC